LNIDGEDRASLSVVKDDSLAMRRELRPPRRALVNDLVLAGGKSDDMDETLSLAIGQVPAVR
jgi:hypothetical protein